MFDPYDDWLSIPKDQRPISVYAMLGITPKETDRAVIEKAASIQAELVSQYLSGPHAAIAERILKEIETAKVVVLDPVKRKAYDAQHRKPAAGKTEQPQEIAKDDQSDRKRPTKTAPKSSQSRPSRVKNRKEQEDDQHSPDENGNESAEKKSRLPPILIVSGAAFLLLLVGGGVGAYFAFFRKDAPPTPAVAQSTTPRDLPPPTSNVSPKTEPNSKPQPTTATKPPDTPKQPEPQPTKPAEVVKAPPPKPPEPAKPAPAPVVRIPVPSDSDQARAEQALKETFKAEYAKAKPEDKIALAAKFLLPGQEDRKDPAAWFVSLREARELSVQAARPRLALAAIDEIDHWFVIDAPEMRVKALADIAGASSDTVAASVYRQAMNLIQQAYDKDDYAAAKRYASAIEGAVRDKNLSELLNLVRMQKTAVDEYAKEHDLYLQARANLSKNPDNPEANLTAGTHLCFFLSDWAQGLPMLAKCSDASLKEQARKDLSQPPDVAGQLAVADGWWSRIQPLKEREQRNVRKWARTWYERAGALATGADRTKVIERIIESQRAEYAQFKRLIPGSFLGRGPEDHVLLLREGGGNAKSEEAIERGLDWLAKHQSSTGIWSTDGFQKANKCACGDRGEKHDVAGTGLGILTFVGVGETHMHGKHAGTVAKAMYYLISQQQQKTKGNFHDNAYENAIATIAIVELYGLSHDARLKLPAQGAINYIVYAQNRNGGWGYTPETEKPDMSVCGWQFTALKAAVYAGLTVPKETFTRLSGFLDNVADPAGLGYGYNMPGNTASTSAVGLLCREFLDWGPGHPGLIKAIDFLLRTENVPTKEKTSIYSVFYITQVAHHYGGERWERWNTKVRDLLIDLQDKGADPKLAHQKGSWGPMGDAWAKQGGRMVYTCLALLTLETYYYHIPLYGYGPYTLLD